MNSERSLVSVLRWTGIAGLIGLQALWVAFAQTASPPPLANPVPGSTAPAPPSSAGALGSEQFSGNPALRSDLLEVRRLSGGALRIKWRVVNTAASDIYYNFDWSDLYFIDPAENKKYGFLTDTQGERILDVYWGIYKPGEQRIQWAKFPAPPEASTKITVHLPKFTPFEDVPVAP